MREWTFMVLIVMALSGVPGCSSGAVEQRCEAPCSTAGATECTDGRVHSCVADARGCLGWSAWANCEQGICGDAFRCRSNPRCGDSVCDSGESCQSCAQDCLSDPKCSSCTGAPDCDDGNLCTTDRCADAHCQNLPLPAGAACDDETYCTGADSCDGAGHCDVHAGDPCLVVGQRCDETNRRCVTCAPDSVTIANVKIEAIKPDSVRIIPDFSEVAESRVEYGASSGIYDNVTPEFPFSFFARFDLEGLNPSTRYYFKITARDIHGCEYSTPEGSFETTSPEQLEAAIRNARVDRGLPRNHYVRPAPNGSDSNPGSESSPFATIRHALAQTDVGDTVFVMQGTYTELDARFPRSGIDVAPIRVTTYSDDAVTFTSGITDRDSRAAGFNVGTKSYITIDGSFVLTYHSNGINLMDCHDVTIKKVKIFDSWSDAIETQSSGNEDAKVYNILVDGVDLQRAGLHRGDGAKLIDVDGVSARFYFTGAQNHNIIRNSLFVEGTHNAIDLHESVNDILIFNNVFERCTRNGPVSLHNWEVFRCSVVNNTMTNNQQDLTFVGAYDNFVSNNVSTGAAQAAYIGVGTYCDNYPAGDVERCHATWTPVADNVFMGNTMTGAARFSMQGGDTGDSVGKEGTGMYYRNNVFLREDVASISFMNLSEGPATDFVDNQIIDCPRSVLDFEFGYHALVQATTNTKIAFSDNTVFTMSVAALGTPTCLPTGSSLTLPTATPARSFSMTKYPVAVTPSSGSAAVSDITVDTSLPMGSVLATFAVTPTGASNIVLSIRTLIPRASYSVEKNVVDMGVFQADDNGTLTFTDSALVNGVRYAYSLIQVSL